jgi:hypothetical protein
MTIFTRAGTKTGTNARSLAVLGLAAVAGTLSGCIIETSSSSCGADRPAVQASWTIVKQATNAVLSCDQAAASEVDLFLNQMRYQFSCNAGIGVTTALPSGTYNAQLTLLDINKQTISQTQSMPVTVSNCALIDLGDVEFGVN